MKVQTQQNFDSLQFQSQNFHVNSDTNAASGIITQFPNFGFLHTLFYNSELVIGNLCTRKKYVLRKTRYINY